MPPIPFWKMSGSGNDFILIDNRHATVKVDDLSRFAAGICRRKMSAGADGLILVENAAEADFKWRFFNADGSVAEMCGNGARCAARVAFMSGIAGERMQFETRAGVINVGRAGTMDYQALADNLRSGHIAGAIIDVFDPEPLPKRSSNWDECFTTSSPVIWRS